MEEPIPGTAPTKTPIAVPRSIVPGLRSTIAPPARMRRRLMLRSDSACTMKRALTRAKSWLAASRPTMAGMVGMPSSSQEMPMSPRM